MCKFNSSGTRWWNCLRVCIIIALFLCLTQIVVVNAASSTTCTSSSNCTLREWLVKLQEENSSLECSLAQLEKSTALLSKVNYSTTSTRLIQIEKLKKAISNLKGEIEIINLTCSTFYGPDCNQTTPECNSKCLTCAYPNVCSNCTGNWDGPTCSVCKTGWNGTDCNIPICDSKCSNCSSPGVCTNCTGNWDGPTCSTCKSGWNGTSCNIPVCDSKCISCALPGQCTNCTGNWNGTTCSNCKSGWNGTLCNTPICDSKCTNCTMPGICSSCSGNWNGTTCALCKTGWNGTLCNIPICDTKCTNCSSPGICSNCTGNWNGTTCSVCKSGWSGIDCNSLICGSNCASCASSSLCASCKTGWYGADCNSNFPLILNSTQITKFTSTIMSNAQITSSKLLFKASRDGYTASAFHSKCDNKGPTIVIIKATTGAIFGGYTSSSWQSLGGSAYVTDNSAFLFSLVSSTKEDRFTKLIYQNSNLFKNGGYSSNTNAILNYAAVGPTFGAGNDISIADNCNTINNSMANLCNSYCDATMTYNKYEAQYYMAGSYYFYVDDYEVYSL